MPWWSPQTHADRRPLLIRRGAIKASIRGHFLAQGFTEVECGALVVSPGNETHLHAFETRALGPDGASQPLYLHTSPEFAAKKLWRREKKGFSISPGCSATGSAAGCMRRNLPCWNGTAPARTMTR